MVWYWVPVCIAVVCYRGCFVTVQSECDCDIFTCWAQSIFFFFFFLVSKKFLKALSMTIMKSQSGILEVGGNVQDTQKWFPHFFKKNVAQSPGPRADQFWSVIVKVNVSHKRLVDCSLWLCTLSKYCIRITNAVFWGIELYQVLIFHSIVLLIINNHDKSRYRFSSLSDL